MLPEFKKRIDTMRQILVGAVPSPQGQIDQITYALIYKFLNDIDDRSSSLPGGKRIYFVGEYEKYSWHNLLQPSLGAHDRLTLYRLALESMQKNSNLPELFQGIYQNAFLPFNDPRVLNLFLKEVDKFRHSSSDDIGDAYEYLLQITGSQGDVGQFRTPRHIIKFIVEAVNPTKDDSVLDPAVGTAGFLIAAFNHVKRHHDGVDEITDAISEQERQLTSDELNKLHHSYHGFDIDPTMVRTAKVNMYLHGFTSPDIKNHDSLSSEDFWNERYDVILANPPFMSPKGGIKPHDKFGIKANRAEVLFVDYIASHLKPMGRAGIVVPEGIIFQSGKAYKELRKNLVENYLYAVVSLPAGVFQPYSGVKTSVLLLDRNLAKQRDEVLFVKIENDGYSLGAQRREVSGNQLPAAWETIKNFQAGESLNSPLAHTISRKIIAESGDYNLNGDKYKTVTSFSHDSYPSISLAELEIQGSITFLRGSGLTKKDIVRDGKYRCIHYGELYTLYDPVIKDVISTTNERGKILSQAGDVLVPATTTADAMGIAVARSLNVPDVVLGGDINIIRTNNKTVLADYLSWSINYPLKETLARHAKGVNIYHLSNADLRKLSIILPPLDVQRKIVTELDDYRKIINAAQTIEKTYRPDIKINQKWNSARLGNHLDVFSGYAFRSDLFNNTGDGMPIIRIRDLKPNRTTTYYSGEYDKKFIVNNGDLLVGMDGEFNPTIWRGGTALLNQRVCRLQDFKGIHPTYALHIIRDELKKIEDSTYAVTVKHLSARQIREISVKIPNIEDQLEIVAELKAEEELIDANRRLVRVFTRKIEQKIAEIWDS